MASIIIKLAKYRKAMLLHTSTMRLVERNSVQVVQGGRITSWRILVEDCSLAAGCALGLATVLAAAAFRT
jgi:hypothetical protein